MRTYLAVVLIGIFVAHSLLPNGRTQAQTPDYKNPSLPIDKRVDDLVSRMTLEEKVSQMMNGAAAIELRDGVSTGDRPGRNVGH